MTSGLGSRSRENQSQETRFDDFLALLPKVDRTSPRRLDLMTFSPWFNKSSKHWFLKLSAFSKDISEWLTTKYNWKPQVKNLSLGMIGEELPDRSITRDLTWGIPIPLDNYETKRIYVWFEAVIGYLSAAIEWSASERNMTGNPDLWKDWWMKDNSETYYFVGKDNIPFHAIIWPAMLLGYGGLNLPTNVPANQYLMMSGTKASKSRGTAVWMPDVLDHFHPDVRPRRLSAQPHNQGRPPYQYPTKSNELSDQSAPVLWSSKVDSFHPGPRPSLA